MLVMSNFWNSMDCSLPDSSVHGILQVKILEWVAISFSRGSSQPRNRTWVSCIAGRFFTDWAVREVLSGWVCQDLSVSQRGGSQSSPRCRLIGRWTKGQQLLKLMYMSLFQGKCGGMGISIYSCPEPWEDSWLRTVALSRITLVACWEWILRGKSRSRDSLRRLLE